jgi:RNA polymerase sigma-70 factor (ECF subfamily)
MVEDLAQETFLAAYRSLAGYPPEIPFCLWLLRIAKNRALNYLREEATRRSHERGRVVPVLLEAQIQRLGSGDEELSRHEDRLIALKSCIEQLPPQGALLIRSRYFHNERVKDIAGRTGREKGAVGVALLRLRQALRQCMESKVAALEAGS